MDKSKALRKTANKDVIAAAAIGLQNNFPYLSAVLTPFFTTHPGWEFVFYSAIGLYGVYMACNQEEVNEIVSFIEDHPGEFREEIVRSKEFQKGFLVFTENYLKQRIEKKKVIVQRILLGFTVAPDKSHYEIERLNDCLMRMSIDTLEFLFFYKREILPKHEQKAKSLLPDKPEKGSDRSDDWWFDWLMGQIPTWEFFHFWILENYHSNSKKAQKQYNVIDGKWEKDMLRRVELNERDKTKEIKAGLNELVTLGIFSVAVDGSGKFGGSNIDYQLTAFGRKFLAFITTNEK